jgi:DNA-binding transcriptional ArsR family regulator
MQKTKINTNVDVMSSTSLQKVLKYLCDNFDKEHYDAEVARNIHDLSKASVNNSLKQLYSIGLIQRRYVGNIALNKIDIQNPLLKQYKILMNIALVTSLVEEIKEYSNKVIVFGNSSLGTNLTDEHIDLFIISDKVKSVEKIIENNVLFPKLHLIIHTSKQADEFKKEAPMFFESVYKGIHLL